eukprot:jgi/Mesen1/7797/ME000408S06907
MAKRKVVGGKKQVVQEPEEDEAELNISEALDNDVGDLESSSDDEDDVGPNIKGKTSTNEGGEPDDGAGGDDTEEEDVEYEAEEGEGGSDDDDDEDDDEEEEEEDDEELRDIDEAGFAYMQTLDEHLPAEGIELSRGEADAEVREADGDAEEDDDAERRQADDSDSLWLLVWLGLLLLLLQRPSRNTVGDVPLEWYKEEGHIGYTKEGQKIVKKERKDRLDAFLARTDDDKDWYSSSSAFAFCMCEGRGEIVYVGRLGPGKLSSNLSLVLAKT